MAGKGEWRGRGSVGEGGASVKEERVIAKDQTVNT